MEYKDYPTPKHYSSPYLVAKRFVWAAFIAAFLVVFILVLRPLMDQNMPSGFQWVSIVIIVLIGIGVAIYIAMGIYEIVTLKRKNEVLRYGELVLGGNEVICTTLNTKNGYGQVTHTEKYLAFVFFKEKHMSEFLFYYHVEQPIHYSTAMYLASDGLLPGKIIPLRVYGDDVVFDEEAYVKMCRGELDYRGLTIKGQREDIIENIKDGYYHSTFTYPVAKGPAFGKMAENKEEKPQPTIKEEKKVEAVVNKPQPAPAPSVVKEQPAQTPVKEQPVPQKEQPAQPIVKEQPKPEPAVYNPSQKKAQDLAATVISKYRDKHKELFIFPKKEDEDFVKEAYTRIANGGKISFDKNEIERIEQLWSVETNQQSLRLCTIKGFLDYALCKSLLTFKNALLTTCRAAEKGDPVALKMVGCYFHKSFHKPFVPVNDDFAIYCLTSAYLMDPEKKGLFNLIKDRKEYFNNHENFYDWLISGAFCLKYIRDLDYDTFETMIDMNHIKDNKTLLFVYFLLTDKNAAEVKEEQKEILAKIKNKEDIIEHTPALLAFYVKQALETVNLQKIKDKMLAVIDEGIRKEIANMPQ